MRSEQSSSESTVHLDHDLQISRRRFLAHRDLHFGRAVLLLPALGWLMIVFKRDRADI